MNTIFPCHMLTQILFKYYSCIQRGGHLQVYEYFFLNKIMCNTNMAMSTQKKSE